MILRSLVEAETLDVRKILIILVVEHAGIDLVRVEFLNALDVCLKVIIHIWRGHIEVSVLQYDEYLVAIAEVSQQISLSVMIETVDIRVIPHFLSAESGASMTLQTDAMERIFGDDITPRTTSFDCKISEVIVEEYLLQLHIWLVCYLYHFGFTIRIG